MARITVEDCIKKVPNRFDLVLMATRRARQIANGAEPMIPWDADKPTVVALREIAEGKINAQTLAELDAAEARAEAEAQAEAEAAARALEAEADEELRAESG